MLKQLVAGMFVALFTLPLIAQDPPKIEQVARKNSKGVLVEAYKTVDGKKPWGSVWQGKRWESSALDLSAPRSPATVKRSE